MTDSLGSVQPFCVLVRGPELEKRDAGVKHSGFGGEAARMTSKAANPSKKRRKTENMTDEEKRERRCATFSCAQLRYLLCDVAQLRYLLCPAP